MQSLQTETAQNVIDTGSVLTALAAASGLVPWILAIPTIPYLIYRALRERQAWINERKKNGETNT
jgi:hypothetical protein